MHIHNLVVVVKPGYTYLNGKCYVVINIYRITSTILINGANSKDFMDIFAPALKGAILGVEFIAMANQKYKDLLTGKPCKKAAARGHINAKRRNRKVRSRPPKADTKTYTARSNVCATSSKPHM